MTPDEWVSAITTEIGTAGCPTPDDILSELSPLAQLYFVEQLAYGLLHAWAARIAADVGTPEEAPEGVVQALDAVGIAAGNLDAALILMGVLPEDAAG